MQSNGHVPSLSELREQVERQELLLRQRTLETAYNWYDDFVNPAEPLFDTPDFFFPLAGENLPFNLDNRQKGELLPVYITEYGLKILRDYSRWLAAFNPFALNALENRVSYTVGTGFGYRAVPANDDDPQAWRLCRQAQAVIDDFLERTDWGELEQEILRRADRDGEAFLRFFPTGNGNCTVRTVEPEHVKSPGDQSAHLSFGVETPEHDVQDVQAFWIVEDPSLGWSPSRVPADEVVHIRLNVDRSAKRGYPTLIPVRRNLLRADKLLQNMSTLAQVQATFALIRKHKQYPASAVQSWQQSQADLAVGDPVSGNTRYLQRYLPGTILDVPDQTDYEFPAAKVPADSLVAVLQAELRAVAARLVLPEYMLTSNAENANYASTLVAEAPAVKHFQRLQRQLARTFGDGRYGGPRRCGALWRVLECAVRWGKLSKDVFRRVALHVEPPSPVARDRDKETARAAALNKAGVLSKATWSKWEGLDPAREQRQIKRERQQEQSAARDGFTEQVRGLLEMCQPHKTGPFVGTGVGYDPDNHNANCQLDNGVWKKLLKRFANELADELGQDKEITDRVANPRALLFSLPNNLLAILFHLVTDNRERWAAQAAAQSALQRELGRDPDLAREFDAELDRRRAQFEQQTPRLRPEQRRREAPWLYKDFKYFAPTVTAGPDGRPDFGFEPTPALRRLQIMQALLRDVTAEGNADEGSVGYGPHLNFQVPRTDEQALAWFHVFGATHPTKLANVHIGGGGLESSNSDLQLLVPIGAMLRGPGSLAGDALRMGAEVGVNLGVAAAAEKAAAAHGPAAGAAVPLLPTLLSFLARRPVVGRAFQRFARRRNTPVTRPGSADLNVLRERLGLGADKHTIAVGRTNVPGLESNTFEGASASIRKDIGQSPLPISRPIKSPNPNPLFSGHAEEVLANDFVTAVERANIRSADVKGDLWIHISNPAGVCNICAQGLRPGSTVPPGVVRQLSEKYPNLTIRFTAEGGAARPNLPELAVRNGRIVE